VKRVRDVLSRGFAVLGFLACVGLSGANAWIVWRAIATGVARGKYGAVYLRSEGDFFFYSTVVLHGIASVTSLGLVVFVVVVLARWKDWT
jgi:hypothetical protein